MEEKICISDSHKDLFNNISSCIGLPYDAVMTERFYSTSSDYARGYINSFSVHADDSLAILAYFVLELLMKKDNQE